MKSLFALACAFALLSPVSEAMGETLGKAYLDPQKNVHVVTTAGRDRRITHTGNADSVKLAPDNKTVGWQVMNTWTAEGDDGPQSEKLVIYRDGKPASIKCDPFVRDYWFRERGAQVVVDCGGRHFAGVEILYDTRTMNVVATLDQAKVPLEKRPGWALGGELQDTEDATAPAAPNR